MANNPLTTPSETRPVETVLIRPTRGWAALNLKDLWIFRELIYFLTWRDIKVRYAQTLLGVAWAVLRPVVQMIVFSLIFGSIANLDSEGVPYPIFTFTALLPWQLFSKAMSDAGQSLVANRNMITKVYFPRLTIPLSSQLSGLVDFAIAFLVLVVMMLYYDIPFTRNVVVLPFFIFLSLITSLGVGLWFSAMNVHYRDIGYMLPFLTEVWKYITPVAYSAQYVTGNWQIVYALNPMAGVVQGFRWAILGIEMDPSAMMTITISTIVSIIVFITGLFYFRRMEKTFADTV